MSNSRNKSKSGIRNAVATAGLAGLLSGCAFNDINEIGKLPGRVVTSIFEDAIKIGAESVQYTNVQQQSIVFQQNTRMSSRPIHFSREYDTFDFVYLVLNEAGEPLPIGGPVTLSSTQKLNIVADWSNYTLSDNFVGLIGLRRNLVPGGGPIMVPHEIVSEMHIYGSNKLQNYILDGAKLGSGLHQIEFSQKMPQDDGSYQRRIIDMQKFIIRE